jgi:HlyD family secretion protein
MRVWDERGAVLGDMGRARVCIASPEGELIVRRASATTVSVGVWVAVLAVVVAWQGIAATSLEAVGVGFSPAVQIAPLETGRLLALEVDLHARVTAHDIVARIDPVLVQAEHEYAEAFLLATQDQVRIDRATESRRFAESTEGSELTRAALVSAIEEDQAQLRALGEQRAIEEGLVANGAASGLMADTVQWEIDVVQARLDANRAALRSANLAATNAAQRNSAAPGINEWEIVAAARAVDLIDRRMEEYALEAGIDGHVTQIYASVGSIVSEAVPVLEVRRVSTTTVLAFVRPGHNPALVEGQEVEVLRHSGQSLPGRVTSIGGSTQTLPMSLWTAPRDPEYGLPLRVELLAGEVFPDEPVRVLL